MHLLQPKEINDKVNSEKKSQIDSGLFLARKIDALREDLLNLQKERHDFIENNQKVINDSLVKLYKEESDLKKEISELEVKRKELLKPLDKAWDEVNKTKLIVEGQFKENFNLRGKLKEDEKELKKNEQEISQIIIKIRLKEQETERARNEILSLKELAQREYEIAKENSISHATLEEQKLKELQGKITTYTNGIELYEKKEKDLVERENKLLSDSKHLESQQQSLKVAYEKIKKYGNSDTTIIQR